MEKTSNTAIYIISGLSSMFIAGFIYAALSFTGIADNFYLNLAISSALAYYFFKITLKSLKKMDRDYLAQKSKDNTIKVKVKQFKKRNYFFKK